MSRGTDLNSLNVRHFHNGMLTPSLPMSHIGSKRRLSEDEEMYGGGDTDFHSYQSRTEPSDQRKSPFSRHAEIKRLKTGSQRRFPISRLLSKPFFDLFP